jgi:hypothetical protein
LFDRPEKKLPTQKNRKWNLTRITIMVKARDTKKDAKKKSTLTAKEKKQKKREKKHQK